jgi:c-di-GMP-related signal transduction protein
MKTPSPVAHSSAQPALVARQPIFGARLTVIAYELLYRAAPELDQSVRPDGSMARKELKTSTFRRFT